MSDEVRAAQTPEENDALINAIKEFSLNYKL